MKFEAPEPWPRRWGGRTLSAPDEIAGNTRPSPTREIIVHHASVQKAVWTFTAVISQEDAAKIAMPAPIMIGAGTLSDNRPAMGNTSSIAKPEGIRRRPACVGVMPWICCTKTGSK